MKGGAKGGWGYKGDGKNCDKGKGEGQGGSKVDGGPKGEKDWSKEKCFECGGLHLAKLRGKQHCPNRIAEEKGTAEENKRNNVKCDMWVDRNKTHCGGNTPERTIRPP